MATSDKPVLVDAGRTETLPMWLCHHCEARFRSKASAYRNSGWSYGEPSDDGDYTAIACPSCGKSQTIKVERPSVSCKNIVYTIYTSD